MTAMLGSAARDRVEMTAALSLQVVDGMVTILSGSCQECVACRRHLPDHCTKPGTVSPQVSWSGSGSVDLAAWAALLTAGDVLLHSEQALPRVGVVGAGPSLALVGRCLAGSGVSAVTAEVETGLAAASEEVRGISNRFRERWDGTAPDVVLATDDNLALAARLVRRGGAVAAVGSGSGEIPMASLVQRELTVLMARDRVSAAQAPLLAEVYGWVRRKELIDG